MKKLKHLQEFNTNLHPELFQDRVDTSKLKHVNEFIGLGMNVGPLIKFLMRWAEKNPKAIPSLKKFVEGL